MPAPRFDVSSNIVPLADRGQKDFATPAISGAYGGDAATGWEAGQFLTLSGFQVRKNRSLATTFSLTVRAVNSAGSSVTLVSASSNGGAVGEWVTVPTVTGAVSIPVDTVRVTFSYVANWSSGTGSNWSTRNPVVGTEAPLVDVGLDQLLALEVEQDPVGLVNLVQNPSGATGGYGWVTPVTGSVLRGRDGALEYTTATAGAAGNYFHSEPLPTVAGQYAAARWFQVYAAWGYYRARIDWLNSAQALIGQTSWTSFFDVDQNTGGAVPAALAPTGTAFSRIRFELGSSTGAYPYRSGGARLTVRDVTVARASTSAALANLAVLEPVVWADVLDPASEVSWRREELGAGTLSATILDSQLDPAVATTLQAGRRVRLTCLNPATGRREPLFTGTVDGLETGYDLRRLAANPADRKHARVLLTASDSSQRLANANRPDGVARVSQLPAVLEGAGVPWVCDGDSNQVSAPAVSRNGNASALDQVAITRDSVLGFAWVDRFGVLQAWSGLPDPSVEVAPNGGFESTTTGWYGFDGTLARDTTVKSAGLASARLTRGTALTAAEAAPAMRLQTVNNSGTDAGMLTVIPGTTYVVTAKARAGTAARAVPLTVDWFYKADGAVSFLSSSGDDFADPAATTDAVGTWTTITRTVTAPPGANAADIMLNVVLAAGQTMPAGEQHWFDEVSMRAVLDVPVIAEADYSEVDTSFSTSRVINEVTVKLLRPNLATGETVEVPYGPYRDQASIDRWKAASTEVTVHGIADTPAAVQAYASRILAANATPAVRVSSVTMPVRSSADLTAAKAFAELYSLVDVRNAAKGINQRCRVVSVEHSTTPRGWQVTLGFQSQGGVATPTQAPPVQRLPSEEPAAPLTQAGLDVVAISAINVVYSKRVTFPTPYPAGTLPAVVVTTRAPIPNRSTISVSDEDNTGFTCYILRTQGTANTGFSWVALPPT